MGRFWKRSSDSQEPRKESDLDALAERFRALGAPDPEQWAQSEISEGIPQLARFCFLARLWPEIIDIYSGSSSWITHTIEAAEREPDAPFADAGTALKRILEAGVDPDDIGRVARRVAYDAVFGVLEIIDEGSAPAAPGTCPGWRLVEVGDDERVTGREIGGLHESVLSLDPSGREGRSG